jgi:hypothetical protein
VAPEVAYSPDGDAIVAFQRVTNQDERGVDVLAAVRRAGEGEWRGTETLPFSSLTALVAEPSGRAIVGADASPSKIDGHHEWTVLERTTP